MAGYMEMTPADQYVFINMYSFGVILEDQMSPYLLLLNTYHNLNFLNCFRKREQYYYVDRTNMIITRTGWERDRARGERDETRQEQRGKKRNTTGNLGDRSTDRPYSEGNSQYGMEQTRQHGKYTNARILEMYSETDVSKALLS
jgi:hypothetical protein